MTKFTLEMIEGKTFYLATKPLDEDGYASTVEFHIDGIPSYCRDDKKLANTNYEVTENGNLHIIDTESSLDITLKIVPN